MQKMIYKAASEKMKQGEACNLVTVIRMNESDSKAVLDKYLIEENDSGFSREPVLKEQDGNFFFYEPVSREGRLIILGGGHISKALCAFAARAGFRPWVIDEREEFANGERFPEADRVLCGPYLEALSSLAINKSDYVAILTRGHSCDGECLRYILNHSMPGYLGMIGSKRRVKAQLAMLEEEGVPSSLLEQIHTPIGLDIKAVTPEEIAVSILAELILVKRTLTDEGRIKTDLPAEMISAIAACRRPAAVATIVKASGSTPRKEGAKMLVFADGTIEGTIGGGLGEVKVIGRAAALVGTGGSELFHFVMDANVAMEDGMACGGAMDVLIEDITEN